MHKRQKIVILIATIFALATASILIWDKFTQRQAETSNQSLMTVEDTVYINKLSSGENFKYLFTTQSELLISSSEIQAQKVAAVTDLTPETWWMQNISLSENRWVLLILRTMESRPTARLIDLDQKVAEQRIVLPFVQTGDIQNSNYGDIIANGFYDVSRQAIIYLIRRNVMTATEGAGITEESSVAEIWSQPVNGGEATLIFSVNAKPIPLQNEEAQYDLPEMIQSAKDGIYLIWRGEVGLVTYEQKNTDKVFTSTLDKDQTSVFLTLHISPIGKKYILEQQDHTGASTTNLYRLDGNNKATLVKAFTDFSSIDAWRPDGSQVAVKSGTDGSLSKLDVLTGKQTALTISDQSDVIPLIWLSDNRLLTTTLSTLDSETGWYTTLSAYDVGAGVNVPVPVQGQYQSL